MPIIDIQTYTIDFLILESNDPKILIILDRSNYLNNNPEKPKLDIVLPGFTGSIEIDYVVGGLTIIDSDTLKLTDNCEYADRIDLPDGVYRIRQRVCPYDELNTNKCYLKTQRLQNAYEDLLLSSEHICDDLILSKLTYELLSIDILIQSAKAEISKCNAAKATEKYNKASVKLTKCRNIINCNK